jgi:hypothetical protein
MKILMISAFYFLITGASEVIQLPNMPSTVTPIENINTAPNPTPSENESEEFRGSTIESQEDDEEVIEEEIYDEDFPLEEEEVRPSE